MAAPLVFHWLRNYYSRIFSHNAGYIPVIHNISGKNGVFNQLFAVSLGGIVYAEKLMDVVVLKLSLGGVLCCLNDGKILQLAEGTNIFGRDKYPELTDPAMSRTHFSIAVSKNQQSNAYDYLLISLSEKKPTIVGNMALDFRDLLH